MSKGYGDDYGTNKGRSLPPPSKPNSICRSGFCCDTRLCRIVEWASFVLFCLLCIGAVALVIYDGATTGYGLD